MFNKKIGIKKDNKKNRMIDFESLSFQMRGKIFDEKLRDDFILEQ